MKKAQMTIPNLLMVIATLAFFAVSIPFFYASIAIGLNGVSSSSAEWFIANLIPGSLTFTILVGIIVYGILRYVSG